MPRINVDINPSILLWAREEAGFELSEIADKLGIHIDKYKQWENNGKNIPLGKLESLSIKFKRQLAVFFLPSVPEKVKRPKDYRNFVSNGKLSKKIINAIRDTQNFRQSALEIQGSNYWNDRYNWLKETDLIKDDKVALIKWLRNKLGVSIEEQVSWKNENEAFKNWRNRVESILGILIFQFNMPLEEIHGFCYGDEHPLAIVVNSNHPSNGKIFSIFHEIAHIISHNSGLCHYDMISNAQHDEYECNSFAGNFLIPDAVLKSVENYKNLQTIAKKLNVSREAYLRRLREANLISHDDFKALLDVVVGTYKKAKKKSGAVKPEVKSRATRGDTYFSMVFDALNKNKISYNQASNLLDLRISRILNEAR